MSMPSVAHINQQQWDQALTRVLDLSTTTIRRNAELEGRVTELELEIAILKRSHSAALEAAENDQKAHNAQVATLNRQISTMGFLKNQDPLILCVIDGDSHIFDRALLATGLQGGRQAAQQLTKGIAEYLAQEDVQVFGRLSFWVMVYVNKRALAAMLRDEEVCSPDCLEAFLVGFGQASPRFILVDVGPGRDVTEAKVKEYLQTHIQFPQTMRVFFGGSDAAYLPTLSAFEQGDLIGKLVMLAGSVELPDEMRHLPVPTISIDGLFMSGRPSYFQRRPGPIGILNGGVVTNGGLISPQSEMQMSAPTTPPMMTPLGTLRHIDPTKPLHKQSPPPCNEHYLMTCSKGAGCKYSHDWLLTPEQLDILAKNAKKAPCNYLKNGLRCPHGDNCCWGHVCPSGSKCFHLSKGKCWFKGDGMHPPAGPEMMMC